MDALRNFHGNQNICRWALELCANLCAKVLDRFFAQLDTKILEKQKHPLFKIFAGTNSRGNTNKSLDHAMPVSEQLHNYPSSNPTLT